MAGKRIFTKKDILTIPNLLSLVRLLLIPVIIWLYIGCEDNLAAITVIALSGLTDIIDGRIARRYNMVSDFGKILDPVADKLTQLSLIVCLTLRHQWMRWLVVLFTVKECVMAILGFVSIRKKQLVNSAQWHGKLTTAVLYGTMIFLILFPGLPLPAVKVIIVLCSLVMLLSLVLYARFYFSIFKDKNGTTPKRS